MSTTIEFAKIDARDDYNTRYSPVAFCAAEQDGPVELGPKNGQLAVMMNREYLVRVAELQAEIRGKYLPQFVTNEKPTPAGEEWDSGLTEDQFNAATAEAEQQFPGEIDHDSLYYS